MYRWKTNKCDEKNKFYGDKITHQDSTSLFGDSISADKIPYIVIPIVEAEKRRRGRYVYI